MIGWVLIARESAWASGAGPPDNWQPLDAIRRVALKAPETFTGPSARYWRLWDEAERMGFGQTVNGDAK